MLNFIVSIKNLNNVTSNLFWQNSSIHKFEISEYYNDYYQYQLIVYKTFNTEYVLI